MNFLSIQKNLESQEYFFIQRDIKWLRAYDRLLESYIRQIAIFCDTPATFAAIAPVLDLNHVFSDDLWVAFVDDSGSGGLQNHRATKYFSFRDIPVFQTGGDNNIPDLKDHLENLFVSPLQKIEEAVNYHEIIGSWSSGHS